MQQRLVLLVGLHVERLIAIFGNLPTQISDRGFILPPRSFVGFDRRARLFKACFGASQFFFDYGDALGEFGDFQLQALDFPVSTLQ